MILEKYQPIEPIQNRGYSTITKVMDRDIEAIFTKCKKGIE